MDVARELALLADRLRHISAMGLRFSTDSYDQENYAHIQDISMALLGLATGTALEELEPLRAPVFSRPTPFVAGDGAVIDEAGQILLIRRADNGLWAMPGGALEVGETPAEGTVREVREETGVVCKAVALTGLYDSRLNGTLSRHHLFHVTFLCRPLPDPPAERRHPQEVLDVTWFAESALPDALDPGHAGRILHAFEMWRGERSTYFDP